jgi:PAS domain S-box-containing protein
VSEQGRILIIDDNPYSADMLEDLLMRSGYDVFRASGGKEALETVPQVEPDVILMEVRLPDTDGYELSRKLRDHGHLRDVPIVFMSGLDDVENKVKGFEFGDDHLTKPIEPREALARIERQVTVSRVKQALRESEAKFHSVMESAIDAIVSADVNGAILSWNRAATALFGHSAQEAIGRPLELIIPERFRDPHRQGIQRVSSGGPSRVIGSTVEVAAIRKGGEEFPIELSLATWFLEEERYYTGIIRDISERKEAEEKFRSVTESAIDAIISADHTGRIMSWNSAATRILGYTSEEAVGQQLELIIPERFHEAHRQGMKRVTSGGESRVIGQTVELFARTRDGEEVPIELSLSTWTVRDERYYTGIIRDISERKQAESRLKDYAEELSRQHEELKLAQGQLIESEKQAMLGRLLAGVLHEVNTPLGALRSATDTIGRILRNVREFVVEGNDNRDGASDKILAALDLGDELSGVLATSADRIEAVADGLGHFVSPEGAEKRTQDIREGLESALTVLGPQIGERIQIVKRFPSENVPVLCDPARLNQAFLNILQNAVDAIDDKGEIRVCVEVCDSRAQVSIIDTGKGMTSEQLKGAFDFNFTKREGRVRLRIGLATSKRAVEEAGGSLTLESQPGHGTKVCVVIPLSTD